MNIQSKDVYTPSLINVLTKASLYNSDPLLHLIKKTVDPAKLIKCPKPFVVSTTNFSTWDSLTLNINTLPASSVAEFMWASASPPYYFPLVNWQGQLLGDSGILSNYNIAQAVKDNCDTIIVIGYPTPEPQVPKTIVDAISQSLSIATQGYFKRELGFVEKVNEIIEHCPTTTYRRIRVVKIIPDRSLGIGILDFNYKRDRQELWQFGYDLAKKVLKEELNVKN
jgi:predicted acylesterase/phospholipase RssA